MHGCACQALSRQQSSTATQDSKSQTAIPEHSPTQQDSNSLSAMDDRLVATDTKARHSAVPKGSLLIPKAA